MVYSSLVFASWPLGTVPAMMHLGYLTYLAGAIVRAAFSIARTVILLAAAAASAVIFAVTVVAGVTVALAVTLAPFDVELLGFEVNTYQDLVFAAAAFAGAFATTFVLGKALGVVNDLVGSGSTPAQS